MAFTDEVFTNESSSNSCTFKADLTKATSDSKAQNQDSSSLYQVKKIVTYSNTEKTTMFEYMYLDPSKSNQEIQNLKKVIESLTNDLSINKKYLSLTSLKFQDVSLTNMNS